MNALPQEKKKELLSDPANLIELELLHDKKISGAQQTYRELIEDIRKYKKQTGETPEGANKTITKLEDAINSAIEERNKLRSEIEEWFQLPWEEIVRKYENREIRQYFEENVPTNQPS